MKTIYLRYVTCIMFALFLSSCSSINRNIYLTRGYDLNNYNINVDLVGINKKQKTSLNSISYQEYWTNLKKRKSFTIKDLNFKANGKNNLLLAQNDPIWTAWGKNNSENLYILTNIQEASGDNSWKYKIPVESYLWFNFWSNKNLYIYISKNGISVNNGGDIYEIIK